MKKRVKITYPAAQLPKAVYGMTVTGKINNRDGSQAGNGSFLLNENGSVPEVEINRTIQGVPREQANLEAEKGETVVTGLDKANSGGIPEFYTIGGNRHSAGGTPLNLPPDSFIFSRDRKMAIKDPEILAQFGKSTGNKGKQKYTFADISKSYDINPFRKILADPSSDKHQIKTAEMMIQNYNLKLGGLAMVQESMKGFPDGIPGIAMPYLEHVGMDPAQFFPQQEQQQQQQAPMPMQQYGGMWTDILQTGGTPNITFDPNLKVNKDSTAITPGTQQVNANLLQPRQTSLTKKYDYLNDYKPTYDASGKKVVYGKTEAEREANPVYKRKTDLSAQELDIRKRMAGIYNLPTNSQGLPDYEQIDPNIILDKSQMPDDLQKQFYDTLYEKRAIRDAEGFQRKQYYGDTEAQQQGYSADTPLEDLNLGIRFATGVQSRQLKELEDKQKAAQLADLTLQRFGGTPKYQQAGEVISEADYSTAADYNASNFDPTAYVSGLQDDPSLPAEANYIQGRTPTPPYGRTQAALQLWAEQDPEAFDTWATANNWGPAIETSSKATRSQSVPSSQKLEASGNAKWDMTADGYDETAVEAGDYVKKADGKWYKVTGYSKKNSAYTGDYENPKLMGKVNDNQANFGRLQQRIDENPELREAIVKQYKATIKKVKPGKNLTESDLAVARAMDDEQIIENFYRAQEQIMAVDAHKGRLNDTTGSWDSDRSKYTNTITELGFDPMTTGETAAFQATYIGLQNLSKDKAFKKDLEDFRVTPFGEADEGASGTMNVSDVDGWFGNTTIGQAAMYAPMAKQIQMEEADWKEEKKVAEKHLGIERGAQKTPFWTEDIINLAGAAKNLFSIRKETPWNAVPGMKLPNATFQSPDQQIQNILSASNAGTQMAGAFGSPQSFGANFANIQANAMQQVANAIGNVADRNVQVANQFELQRTNIMNRSNDRRAQLATNLHDKNAILNQQFTNAKNQAWNEVRENMVKMWTNRGQTQNMNTFNDQYYIDPQTGYKHFRDPRKLIPKDSQRPDIAGQVNDLVGAVPGLDPNAALRYYSKNSADQPFSPTGNMGLDPTQTGPSWPGGAPSGYQ